MPRVSDQRTGDTAPAVHLPIEPDENECDSAALLLMSVPDRIHSLPGLTKRQRTAYPEWATQYLRRLSWQEEMPSPTNLKRFLDRLRARNTPMADQLEARESLIFLHDVVLRIPSMTDAVPPHEMLLSDDEREAVLARLSGAHRLMARLTFDAGLDPTEAARLRAGDLYLSPPEDEPAQVVVRDGAGRCDRIVPVDSELADALRVQLRRVRELYEGDREEGHGAAPIPPSVEAIFPGTADGWEWQFVFPHERRRHDVRTGEQVRDTMGPGDVLATMEAVVCAETRLIQVGD